MGAARLVTTPQYRALIGLLCVVIATLPLTSGCRRRRTDMPAAATEQRQAIRFAGLNRFFLLRIPRAAAQARARVPLVIVLHGGGGNGENAENMTGFTAKARSAGFIVAYPEGTARGRIRALTWNAGHCCGYAMDAQVDDVGFLGALIDHLVSTYSIDPRRIYVTGMSNGAMMAHRVARELPDRIAAIAPVVGGLFGDEVAPGSPVSAIMINGTLDTSVPYLGGPPGGRFARTWSGTPVKPADYQATFWAAANGCSADAGVVETARYIQLRYSCPSSLGVELYAVKDNGHAWPGGQRGSAAGDPPSDALNATDLIWSFFEAHPKR